MNLTSMILKFRERTSGLALVSVVSDSQVIEKLNIWYQQILPTELGGDFAEGKWDLETVALQEEYDYPDYVISPRSSNAWIEREHTSATDPTVVSVGPYFLDTETNLANYVYADRDWPASSTGARPETILFSERKVRLSPIPDKPYIITIPSRVGPQVALGAIVQGLADGIPNNLHAMAVVTGAAWEYLIDVEEEVGAAREGRSHAFYLDKLGPLAHGKARHRRPARSF